MTGAAAGGAGDASPDAKAKGKYNARGRHVGTVWCASEAEAVRYEQLLRMVEEGLVSKLRTQPNYPLTVNGVKIATYRADFAFDWHGPEVIDPRGIEVIEEVKGLETPEWKLKKKLFEALYNRRIHVITKPRNKAWIAEHFPHLVEAMHGKTSDFSHWIRTRYRGSIEP